MKKWKRELKTDVTEIRRCYSRIEKLMIKLVRSGKHQDDTIDFIAAELQRQRERLDKLTERLGGGI